MSTAVAPSPPARRALWRRGWFRVLALLVIGLVLLAVAVATLLGRTLLNEPDDPNSARSAGALAVRTLVEQEGVAVTVTADPDQASAPGGTLVVASPDWLTAPQWQSLLATQPADVVILQPGRRTLANLALPARLGAGSVGESPAGCADPDAVRAQSLDIGGKLTLVPDSGRPEVVGCFGTPAGYDYLQTTVGSVRLHLLAGGTANNELDLSGNAAFAMAKLGQHRQATWLAVSEPTINDGPGGDSGPSLLPPGWVWGWSMGAVALLVVGVWRGRRLGPIISERLPVRVRATEIVEGHGQLYHRIGARAHAAEALRRSTRQNLSRLYGLSDPETLSDAVSSSVRRPPAEVRHALLGPPPASDDDLVSLKLTLDAIEREVRRL